MRVIVWNIATTRHLYVVKAGLDVLTDQNEMCLRRYSHTVEFEECRHAPSFAPGARASKQVCVPAAILADGSCCQHC